MLDKDDKRNKGRTLYYSDKRLQSTVSEIFINVHEFQKALVWPLMGILYFPSICYPFTGVL
jgi:hypothetical protein